MVGGRGKQQTSEEQQEQREERKRQCGGQKKGRCAGSMTESGSGRGRGQHRNRGGRGGRQDQRGRGRGRAGRPVRRRRRLLDKKIQQAERAYSENTNPKIRRSPFRHNLTQKWKNGSI